MKTVSATMEIVNEAGMHARAAVIFVKTAGAFESRIEVTKDGETVNGKSIMGVMLLAATKASKITVTAVGKDAEEALSAIAAVVADGFGEDA